MKKKVLALVLAIAVIAALCIGLVACNDEPDFKVGFLMLHGTDSTYDLNFINAANQARDELGLSKKQVIIKTNVDETNDCAVAARDLVDRGCDLIFADSFGHGPFMKEVAAEYPDVQFCHATGTNAHDDNATENLHNAFASIYEGRYLAGIVAGMKLNEMIAAGTITADEAVMGYVGAHPFAEVISGYTSFYLGAKSVCPSVTMKVTYTLSWYDIAAENTAANTLITSGCKLISQHADSTGAPAACEAASVPNVSYNGSTAETGPNTYLVSSKINWVPYFKYIITQAMNGDPIDKDYVGTIATDSVQILAVSANAAEGTQAAVNAAKAQFVAGTLNVFDTNNFTYSGDLSLYGGITIEVDENNHVTSYKVGGVETVAEGVLQESLPTLQSAPYFSMIIDGITVI